MKKGIENSFVKNFNWKNRVRERKRVKKNETNNNFLLKKSKKDYSLSHSFVVVVFWRNNRKPWESRKIVSTKDRTVYNLEIYRSYRKIKNPNGLYILYPQGVSSHKPHFLIHYLFLPRVFRVRDFLTMVFLNYQNAYKPLMNKRRRSSSLRNKIYIFRSFQTTYFIRPTYKSHDTV